MTGHFKTPSGSERCGQLRPTLKGIVTLPRFNLDELGRQLKPFRVGEAGNASASGHAQEFCRTTQRVGMTKILDWLKAKAPGVDQLSNEELSAISDFSVLWSLFEARILNTEASASAIRDAVGAWQ